MEIAEILDDLAIGLARSMRKRFKAAPRPRGATLRPGVETPLWMALVSEMQPLLRRRGTKALLANQLGLHRSQISKYFVTRSAMPDAERTLEILLWLAKLRATTEQR